MTNATKAFTVCLLGLALVASSLPGTASAEVDRTNRKLLQGFGPRTNLNANTLRAQAATSQAIQEAVDSGASVGSTRTAGVVGTNMAWAASQRDETFNIADFSTSPTARFGKH